jgi:hypothetical protein
MDVTGRKEAMMDELVPKHSLAFNISEVHVAVYSGHVYFIVCVFWVDLVDQHLGLPGWNSLIVVHASQQCYSCAHLHLLFDSLSYGTTM